MWIFDSLDVSSPSNSPSKYGTLEVSTEYVPQRNVTVVTFKTIVSIAMLAGAGYGLFQLQIFPESIGSRLAIIAGIELIYVGIAFFIVPRPNYGDLGYLDGLINNPFRYSDNYNRSLRTWAVLLGPGRFISTSLLDFAALLGLIKMDPAEEMEFAHEMGLDVGESVGSSLASVTCTDLDEPTKQITPGAATAVTTPSKRPRDSVQRGDFD